MRYQISVPQMARVIDDTLESAGSAMTIERGHALYAAAWAAAQRDLYVDDGVVTIQSDRHPATLYQVTATSCTCIGFTSHGRCKHTHRARLALAYVARVAPAALVIEERARPEVPYDQAIREMNELFS